MSEKKVDLTGVRAIRATRKVMVELTDVDLNYIWGPLRDDERQREFEVWKWGVEFGNSAVLLKQQRKTLAKIEKAQKSIYRKGAKIGRKAAR